MSSESQIIIDVWEAVRDHISHNKRTMIATDIVEAFLEYGFIASDCSSIIDEDPDLAIAFDKVFEDEEDDDDDGEL